ncbi:MAG: hypothetical protein LIO43_00450 [Clostridiales bacterium]|nr:hypothetical protein [Clostridiales bacterium]
MLRDFLDIRIKGSDDLTEKYGIPVLGSVPDFSAANSKKQKKKRRNK